MEIEENVQNMLTHYRAQKKEIKAQQEENKNWLLIKADYGEKLKEQDSQMDHLQLSYLNTTGECDSLKFEALQWKEKVNKNA